MGTVFPDDCILLLWVTYCDINVLFSGRMHAKMRDKELPLLHNVTAAHETRNWGVASLFRVRGAGAGRRKESPASSRKGNELDYIYTRHDLKTEKGL